MAATDAAEIVRTPVGFVPEAAHEIELSIVIPCLNEAETLAQVVDHAHRFLKAYGVAGEVIVADNGSTDGSREIAVAGGARVVPIAQRGYGAALRGGIFAARGTYVAMGDADCSYDFMALMPFVEKLRTGIDLVIGNRFQGGIGKGAMPRLHRYLGNPVLSLAGRVLYSAPIGDFHCGLRAFRREGILDLGLSSDGMEYASEMIVKAQLVGLSMAEVPTTLVKDGRSRPPHLRSWRDGWRHLKFLLLFSPRWLFIYPGLALMALGVAVLAMLLPGDVHAGGITLSIHTLLFAAASVLIASQLLSFGMLASHFGVRERYWLAGPMLTKVSAWLSIDRACIVGGTMMLIGFAGAVAALASWAAGGFSATRPEMLMRLSIPSTLLLGVGLQLALTSFLLELLSHPARATENRR
ncbi:glycosyltransferase family 2 protein [Sphingomonas sp. C3-2]|uniref:glycosyltransferase family 2 protein n=1 Tax=Sphingomonas sp. C3-2 TaxID=3062169 RepID=UPI00294ADD5F|nr:glycosyltransferase family 2 protein [Sphingomonas sp. C3-2]WOK35345.1 glycosyltransferase family 2 protein [Sphingomonas sp. C3-2]